MDKFIIRPSINLYPGIKVTKDTELEYSNGNVRQTLKNLIFRSKAKVKGEGYKSTYDTTIYLEEGDVLIFDDTGRGYIKPVENFATIAEAIEDLTNIVDLGEKL